MTLRHQIATILGLGIFAACVTPVTSCGCSIALPTALVVGTVRTADAQPLAGAEVTARGTAEAGCPSVADQRPVEAIVRSDTSGRYDLPVFRGEWGAGQVCVTVVARRSASATADSVTAAPVTVRLSLSAQPDSARVDLVFP